MTRKKSRAKKKQEKPKVYQPSLFDRRRGGQPGNTNALTHGLYSPRFSPEEVENLKGMREGLADEVDLLRVSNKRLLDYIDRLDVDKLKVEDFVALQNIIAKFSATIGRLKQVDKALTDAEKTGLGAQLLAALEDINSSLTLER